MHDLLPVNLEFSEETEASTFFPEVSEDSMQLVPFTPQANTGRQQHLSQTRALLKRISDVPSTGTSSTAHYPDQPGDCPASSSTSARSTAPSTSGMVHWYSGHGAMMGVCLPPTRLPLAPVPTEDLEVNTSPLLGIAPPRVPSVLASLPFPHVA